MGGWASLAAIGLASLDEAENIFLACNQFSVTVNLLGRVLAVQDSGSAKWVFALESLEAIAEANLFDGSKLSAEIAVHSE